MMLHPGVTLQQSKQEAEGTFYRRLVMRRGLLKWRMALAVDEARLAAAGCLGKPNGLCYALAILSYFPVWAWEYLL